MGEIAEGVLDGEFCQECCGYMPGHPPGYPRTCRSCKGEVFKQPKRPKDLNCPVCERKFCAQGLKAHVTAKHPEMGLLSAGVKREERHTKSLEVVARLIAKYVEPE